MNAKYNIVEIDLWEKDAVLEISGYKIYFQFDGDEPTLEDAIKYLVTEVEKQNNTNGECCEGGPMSAGCFHDHCTGPRSKR